MSMSMRKRILLRVKWGKVKLRAHIHNCKNILITELPKWANFREQVESQTNACKKFLSRYNYKTAANSKTRNMLD